MIWVLMVLSGGSNTGSAIDTRMQFRTEAQCIETQAHVLAAAKIDRGIVSDNRLRAYCIPRNFNTPG